MDMIRLGVVGLGWVAQVVHLPILRKLSDAEIVAVCDVDRSRGRLVAEKYGIRKFYGDARQMLANEQLDAVIVCTPTNVHREITLAALEAGKHVLVEKPITRFYTEAVEIAERARATGRNVMVGMNHRFRPDTMVLKSFIEGKELGKLLYVKAGWLRKRTTDAAWVLQREKSGGGVFIDLGIVMLDLALWMLGYPEVRRVSASQFHNKTKQVEDISLVSVTLSSGARIHLEVSWSVYLDNDVYYCDVFGSNGTASMNPLRILKELHGSLVNLAPAKMEAPQNLFKRSYENEIKHFLGAIRGIHPAISTAEEAVQRMKVVDAVYRSVRLGKEVAII